MKLQLQTCDSFFPNNIYKNLNNEVLLEVPFHASDRSTSVNTKYSKSQSFAKGQALQVSNSLCLKIKIKKTVLFYQ